MNALSWSPTFNNESQIKTWIHKLSKKLIKETSIPPTFFDLFQDSLNLAENTIWYILSSSGNLSERDVERWQPLHQEICKFDYKRARYLLKHGNSKPLPWSFSKFKYYLTPEGLIAIEQNLADMPER